MTTSPVTTPSNSSLLTNYINAQNAAASSTSSSSSSSSTSATEGLASSLNLDFSTYLQILTTQLQNQDPTNAADPNQFTQELVEMGSVQQGITTNQDLQQLINLQTGGSISSSLGYIGNYVEAPTSTDQLSLQNSFSEFGYTLASAAKNVTVTIQDSSGATVATLSGSGVSGTNYVAWNGTDSSGDQLADGTYTFQVNATDADGNSIAVSSPVTLARVDSIQSNSDGTMELMCGNLGVSTANVSAVFGNSLLPTPQINASSSQSAS